MKLSSWYPICIGHEKKEYAINKFMNGTENENPYRCIILNPSTDM